MSQVLTASFHGGARGRNNLHEYPGGAKILSTGTSDPSLANAELRGFTLGASSSDTHLYVVNGYKDSSQILRYDPNGGGAYHNGTVWATDHLHHPFDAVWGPGGNLYVSNQDPSSHGHIRITVYQGPAGRGGTYVGVFAEGFVALRGITWVGDTLWVADEKGGPRKTGALVAYRCDSAFQGTPTGASIAVDDPVHVLYDGSRYIYVGSGSGNCVYAYDPASRRLATVASSTTSVPIDAASGLALATDGATRYLYVGNRKGNAINRYTLDTSIDPPIASLPTVVQSNLGDNPEFVGVLANGVFN